MYTFKKILIVILFIILSTVEIFAIPAFARKYKLSCQTCHSPIPSLKPYGDDFAGNGFRFPEMQSTRYFVETGDDQLSLIRDFPIAVRLDFHMSLKTGEQKNGLDLQSPYLVKLLSGGELSSKLSYYFYFYMNERGKVVGVEDAYLMFNNFFDQDFDIYFGQFQISDPLFKRELRLTLEDYQVYKIHVGNSSTNLAYDRGLMLTYGLETGTDIIFEIVNGNGIDEADAIKNFDKDKYKNYFLRVSQDVGEYLRIGGFGYLAKEELDNISEINDNITMLGPDLTLGNDKIELNLQYVWRKDSKALHNIVNENVKTHGGIAEVIYKPNGDESKWYTVGLFNWINSDLDNLDYKTLALHAGYLYRRNIRMVAEYKYDLKEKYSMFSIGMISAF
ncbi:MAG: hypothetical protein WAR79_16790 [Melioribacteraceae bacterium]